MATYPPSSWATPASTPLTGVNDFGGEARYLIDTWIAPSINRSTGVLSIRYITGDPSGSWTTVSSLPALPAGFSYDLYTPQFAATDGTTYAVAANIASTTDNSTAILYTTDPAGSWSVVVTDHWTYDFIYADGLWVRIGERIKPTPRYGQISYASSLTGTWTTALDGTSNSVYEGIAFGGGTWVRHRRAGTSWQVQYASSIGGTWTNSTTGSNGGNLGMKYLNGYFISLNNSTSGGSPSVLYATDATTGSWGTATCGFGASGYVSDIAWDGTYWAVAGYDGSGGRIGYQSTASPGGTYTTATGYSTSADDLLSIDAGNGYMVASRAAAGELRYAFTNSPEPPGPFLLRQRQSETRTPSRVRGVDLRQRQTTRIR